jgi:hypothetical protein
LTGFEKLPRREEDKETFKKHFIMDKLDGGVLLVRMHRGRGPSVVECWMPY